MKPVPEPWAQETVNSLGWEKTEGLDEGQSHWAGQKGMPRPKDRSKGSRGMSVLNNNVKLVAVGQYILLHDKTLWQVGTLRQVGTLWQVWSQEQSLI